MKRTLLGSDGMLSGARLDCERGPVVVVFGRRVSGAAATRQRARSVPVSFPLA